MVEETYANYLGRVAREGGPEGETYVREKLAAVRDFASLGVSGQTYNQVMNEKGRWDNTPGAFEETAAGKRVVANRLADIQAEQTGFNISKFRSNVGSLNENILPKHSFLVKFSPFGAGATPSRYANALNTYLKPNTQDDFVLRCESAQLPGATLLKEEVRRFGYGTIEDVPYGVQFQDMTLGFISDYKGSQVKFFYEWLNIITNFNSQGGNMMRANDYGSMPYEVAYKDEFINRQMDIFVYDRNQQQTVVYELYDVFPTAINATDVSWSDVDQLMKFYVRFSYTDYSMKTPKISAAPTRPISFNPTNAEQIGGPQNIA